jgi:hypothetical protein
MNTQFVEMEEARMGYLGAGLPETLIRVVGGLPQTQADIQRIAAASEYAQSPQFQTQFKEAKSEVEQYLYAQMAFQAVATVATFGIFLMMLYKFTKKGGND